MTATSPAVALLLLGLCNTAFGRQAPLPEKQDLFEARTGGYHTYRIPTLLATRGGVVLVTAEARTGRGGDYDRNDVLMRRSTDGGRTFAPAVKLLDHAAYGAGPLSNVVMFSGAEAGRVTLLFCHDYARIFAMHSRDDGATWGRPVEITAALTPLKASYAWQVCATGPGHGTVLRNGRMVAPLWLSDGSGTEMGKGKRGHRPSAVAALVSDDQGQSWTAGEIVARHGQRVDGTVLVNPSETVAAELADGRVLFNIRSESKIQRRLVATSPDGASGWTGFRWDDALLEPVCMGSLVRYDWPTEGKPGRLLFVNPDNIERTMHWGHNRRPVQPPHSDRKRLSIKLSRDDGRTWPVTKVIEAGPAGYSDVAVLADDTILCLYEAEVVGGMCDDRYLRLVRFDLKWLEQPTDGPVPPASGDSTQ